MEDSKIVEILMDLQKNVASIQNEQKSINQRLDTFAEHQRRIDELQRDNASTKASMHFIWIILSAFIIFFGADILAPVIVNWLVGK